MAIFGAFRAILYRIPVLMGMIRFRLCPECTRIPAIDLTCGDSARSPGISMLCY